MDEAARAVITPLEMLSSAACLYGLDIIITWLSLAYFFLSFFLLFGIFSSLRILSTLFLLNFRFAFFLGVHYTILVSYRIISFYSIGYYFYSSFLILIHKRSSVRIR